MSTTPIDTGYNWLKSATEGPHAHRTNSLAISLSLADELDENSPLNSAWLVEPGPDVDYSLVHSLVKLAHHVLREQDHERLEELNHTRQKYYQAHFHFQHAYRGLADTQAYERILEEQRKELLTHGEQKAGAWKELEVQKRRNTRELRHRLVEVKNLTRSRNSATMKLSAAKKSFVLYDLDRLVYICRHLYLQRKGVLGTCMNASICFDIRATSFRSYTTHILVLLYKC